MLKEQKFFKFFWRVVEYFGVYYHRLNTYQKVRALTTFTISTGISIALYFIALIAYDDMESRLNGLQTLPFLFQMLLDGSNFAAKCRSIEELYNKIGDAFERVNGAKHFTMGYRIFLRYAAWGATSGAFVLTSGILIFLMTGRTSVLVYLPYDHGIGFFAIWLMQAFFFYYSGLLNYLLDAFMNGLLILLSSYAKAHRSYIRERNMTDLREIVQLDLELRTMLRSYEDIYSTVILYRGAMTILSISASVLDIVNGASNGTGALIGFATNILIRFFLPSYFGNEIQYEYEEFLNDIYGFDWIEAGVEERKNFIFIQTNLMRGHHLTAAKVFPINLHTFLRILQSCYSFYAVLKQVKG